MDAVFLARLQFALTIGFHFIFPPLTIGTAWLLVVAEWMGWRRNDAVWDKAARFFAKLFAITFAIGVATGVVMEFQFGMNWANYSKFVGDIFGAPLAAEGVFAFFLESGFVGLYLFGRGRIPRWLTWFSTLMVAVGSSLSAFWIIVANSWQQTPAGFEYITNELGQKAVLTDFWAAVFNPSTLPRFFHTISATVTAGAFFMTAVSAWLILKGRGVEAMKKTMKLGVIIGLIAALTNLYPTGHIHASQVAETQPPKFAAIEGLYETTTEAPLLLFGIPTSDPAGVAARVELPGMLSWIAYGDTHAEVKGLNDFDKKDWPPLKMTFISFHTMVGLGSLFILLAGLGALLLPRGRLFTKKWLLRTFVWVGPLPIVAIEFGWMTAEVGRQPWVVYPQFLANGLPDPNTGMRTADAVSIHLSSAEILTSIILFGLIYLFLGAIWIYILGRKINKGPDPIAADPIAADPNNATDSELQEETA